MLNYNSYLEDVIYCNDRSIKNLNGWNPDGGSVTDYLQFKEYDSTTDLSCTNITDRFSVSNNSAKSKYRVGLATNSEMNLLNNRKIRASDFSYWTSSPYYFVGISANERYVSTGSINQQSVYYSSGVRPAISLKPGIEYTSGDGSMANPYVVDAPPVIVAVNAENVSYGNTLTGVNCADAQCMIDYINGMLN